MAAEVHPAELAALLDTAERPRAEGWSLRAALTRYAQPQPQRASDLIELVRRIESALRAHQSTFETDGRAIWEAVVSGGADANAPASTLAIDVLRALREIDDVGDVLAAWAVDRAGERPDAAIDAVVADVTARLEALGVEREERPPMPRGARTRRG
jgi:hypothetical protein